MGPATGSIGTPPQSFDGTLVVLMALAKFARYCGRPYDVARRACRSSGSSDKVGN